MSLNKSRSTRWAYLFVTVNLVLLLVFLVSGSRNLKSVQSTVAVYDHVVLEWFVLRLDATDPRLVPGRTVRSMPEYGRFATLMSEIGSSAAIQAAARISPDLDQQVAASLTSWRALDACWTSTVGAVTTDDTGQEAQRVLDRMDVFQSALLRSRDAFARVVATQERALFVLLYCLGATIILVVVVFALVEIENDRDRRAALRTQLLARNTLEIQERERARIAHSLHDSLAQELSLAALESELILGSLPRPDAAVGRKVEALIARLRRSIDWARNLAYELRPAEIDKVGLNAAVRAYCTEMEAQHAGVLEWNVDGEDGLLSPERAMNVYRIVQESVTNAVRHSRASRISLELHAADGWVRLEVRDNGIGMAREADHSDGSPCGLGIAGMEERARILHAALTIESRPRHGTAVRLVVPADGSPGEVP